MMYIAGHAKTAKVTILTLKNDQKHTQNHRARTNMVIKHILLFQGHERSRKVSKL